MAITYGFFDSSNGDRTYNAAQMSEYFEGLVSDGVYESVDSALQVTADGSSMSVSVAAGRAIVDCKWMRNDAAYSIDIASAHASLNRWSAITVRLEYATRQITIYENAGTPASTPVKPTATDSEVAKEIILAYVYVGAAVTTITQANITDARGTSVCPWVTGLIEQVDTSTLFLQYQEAFETYYTTMRAQFDAWFSSLTQELNVNTYIKKFYKKVTASVSTGTTVALDMAEYTYEAGDIINVFINGLFGEIGTDYTIDTSTPAIVLPSVDTGAIIEVQILKSKVGFDILVDEDNNAIVTDDSEYIQA